MVAGCVPGYQRDCKGDRSFGGAGGVLFLADAGVYCGRPGGEGAASGHDLGGSPGGEAGGISGGKDWF